MPAYFAWWRQRFVYIAFVLVAVLAVLPLAAPGFIAVGDAWLWLAIWLSSACVLYVIARQPPVHYRGIWLVLITAFLALLIQNYQEFKSTQNRLTQLHSDLSRRAADLQTLNLENRRNAQTLARDLNDWSVADDTTRTIKENTVASDLNLLQGGIRDADSRMQELHLLIREKASDPATTSVATTTTAATTTTTPTTTSGEQPVTAFRRSMLDPAVNLAQDSARATGAMVASLQL
ncbi:MAG: hypothetical protein JOY61_14265, partial [Chloroflexi bacterium]|nr:hypothetical protein [Chloroflexota bacterium]